MGTARRPGPALCALASLARRPARFALVGGAATLIYAGLTWTAAAAYGVPVPLASPAAYGVAAGWSYLGHRGLTFRGSQPHPRARLRFLALTLVGYAVAFLVPVLMDRVPGGRPEAAILLTCLAVPLANYIVMSRHIFADRTPSARSITSGPMR